MRCADFVQETTTSIAGTSGDGAITLTGIALSPRISDTLGLAKRTIRYTITKTSTGQSEQGIGTAAANVLTRTRPQVTWTGTAWADGSAGVVAPLQFGSTPTAGDVVIRLASTAEGQAPVVANISNSLSSDVWSIYRKSRTMNESNGGGGVALVVGRQYYFVHRVETAGLFGGVQIEVMGTAINPSNIRVGLYDSSPTGLVGDLIVTCNTLNTSTTGFKSDSATGTWSPAAPVWLTPGVYVVSLLPDSATTIRCSPGAANAPLPVSPFGVVDLYGWSYGLYVAQSYASGLQASFSGAATYITNNGAPTLSNPWIGLKITP